MMNMSFVVAGALFLLGLYFTRRAWPRLRLTTWAFAFIALAGLGKIIVGLAPENERLLIHSFGALGIPCSSIGILLLGLAVWQTRHQIAVFSVALGAIGLFGLLGGAVFTGLGHGHGAAERIADYPAIVWMVVLGSTFVWGLTDGADIQRRRRRDFKGSN